MKELLSIEDPIAGLLGAWSAGLNLGSALLRIALIVALAASIGCERSSKRHSAGLRTFVLAAFSATVSMLLDQYVYVLLAASCRCCRRRRCWPSPPSAPIPFSFPPVVRSRD